MARAASGYIMMALVSYLTQGCFMRKVVEKRDEYSFITYKLYSPNDDEIKGDWYDAAHELSDDRMLYEEGQKYYFNNSAISDYRAASGRVFNSIQRGQG